MTDPFEGVINPIKMQFTYRKGGKLVVESIPHAWHRTTETGELEVGFDDAKPIFIPMTEETTFVEERDGA